jgi:hypothetical protein
MILISACSAFGVNYFFEGCISSWSPFLVGWLAQNVFSADLASFDTLSPEEQTQVLQDFAKAPLSICALRTVILYISLSIKHLCIPPCFDYTLLNERLFILVIYTLA